MLHKKGHRESCKPVGVVPSELVGLVGPTVSHTNSGSVTEGRLKGIFNRESLEAIYSKARIPCKCGQRP